MDFLKKIGTHVGDELTKIGISIVLGVVLEVLFKGEIPLQPNVSVVDNIMGILGGLSFEAIRTCWLFVLYHIIKK